MGQQVGGGHPRPPLGDDRGHHSHHRGPRAPEDTAENEHDGQHEHGGDNPKQVGLPGGQHGALPVEEHQQGTPEGNHCGGNHHTHHRTEHQGAAGALLDPVHPPGPHVLAHKGGGGGGKGLNGHKHKGVDFIGGAEPGGEVVAKAVNQGLHDEDCHGKLALLNGRGHPQTDNLPQQGPVQLYLKKADVQEGVFPVDVKNPKDPGADLGKDGGQGHPEHPQVKGQHKDQIQNDVNDAGDGQKEQGRFAVPQALHDAGVYVVPQGAHASGENHDTVHLCLLIGLGGHPNQGE